jgi:PKD domain-containing protein
MKTIKIIISVIILMLIPISSAESLEPIINIDGDDSDWSWVESDEVFKNFKFTRIASDGNLWYQDENTQIVYTINYASGFDLTEGSIFYDLRDISAGNVTLYFKILTNGTIGDADGNGDPRTGTRRIYEPNGPQILEASSTEDFGEGESYRILLDYNGDNFLDDWIQIGGAGDQVKWRDGTTTGLLAAWNGNFLEVGAINVANHNSLAAGPIAYDIRSAASLDLWSEDELPPPPTCSPIADFEVVSSCNKTTQFTSTSDTVCGVSLFFFNWELDDGTNITGVSPIVDHQFATGGTHSATLTVVNVQGFSNTTIKQFEVGEGPVTADAYSGVETEITIDPGQCVTLGGSPTAIGGDGNYEYKWLPDTAEAGLNATDVSNPLACPTANTTYRVEVKDGNNFFDKETCYDADEITIFIQANPAIELEKSCPPSAIVNEVITYEYTVNNTGNADLINLVLTDDKAGTPSLVSGDTNGDNKLNVGETWIYSATYTVPDADSVTNIATVTAEDAAGTAVDDTAQCTTEIKSPGIEIVKSCPPSATVNESITYEYFVNNTGSTNLSDLVLIDDKAGIPNFISGDTNGDSKLNVGETWIYSATYTVPDVDSVTNIVTVTAKDAVGNTVADTDQCTTQIKTLGIKLEKSCPPSAEVNESVTYEYTVTNTGSTDLINVVLIDDKVTPHYVGGDTNNDNKLNVGEVWSYTATYIITESVTNHAEVTAQDANGNSVSDTDECTTKKIPALSTIGLIMLSSLLGIITIFSIKKKE